ncbi:oxidoreductase [Amycolatopsis sp. FU40]|uniref:oxidoreductase n=1 Tax=Amycolatopsis sp. FU40 TaxID=2914159 RepID=UPI001F40F0B8|nr:oxidoreductase [Amycolatopsis sp. FU40]UKD56890.1 oxidoreductase [Amycolatopsis sp. FU40]
MTVLVPLSLGTLALIDAALAGFRAATGRNARIRKRAYYLTASRRGLASGAAGLGLPALLIAATLPFSSDPGARYAGLVGAGARMLQVLTPFAVVVVLSLLAYWLLPMRGSTFVILIGLGPFTLARPAVVLVAVVWSAAPSGDWLVWAVALAAAVAVLAVEPMVHRRWYRNPG